MLDPFAHSSPYFFQRRDRSDLPEINLAAGALATEYFRRDLIPTPLPVSETSSILVLAPHQDDETIGAGGTLCLAREAGADVTVLFLTDGVVTDQETPYSATQWPAVREAEARKVCDRLQARMLQLRVSNITCDVSLEQIRQLAAIIEQTRPDVVLTPWLLDYPPKHRFANHLLFLADRLVGLPDFTVWCYQVHNTLFPNGFVDITAVADEKRALLGCYRSQNRHCHRYDHLAMGLSAWNSRWLPETYRDFSEQYVELFATTSREAHLHLVERFYLPDLEATYEGHPAVVRAARRVHHAVMTRERA